MYKYGVRIGEKEVYDEDEAFYDEKGNPVKANKKNWRDYISFPLGENVDLAVLKWNITQNK